MNWQIQIFDQLESTQTWLLQQAEQLSAGSCVLARSQSAGLGRQDRSWQSEQGGLYSSFLLKPKTLLPALPWALWWAALDAIEDASGLSLTLKAPNDLLVQGRKLAGMLIDSRIFGQQPLYYVCGLGINLNQTEFTGELSQRAISLTQLTGDSWQPEKMLEKILSHFVVKYNLLTTAGFEAAILAALKRRQVQIGYNGREFMTFEEYWHGSEQGCV